VRERVAIRDVPDALLSRGVHAATTDDLSVLTGLDAHAVHEGMARLRAAGKAFTPAKGLYVMVPPEYRTWGSVPAMDFIDPMMRVLDRTYYVAMLSAAELHGAAHQRAQVFQVLVDRHVPDRDVGRSRLRFFTGARVRGADVVLRNSATGTVRVASPEVTALDLVSRPNDCGGLSNVATVICELVEGVGLEPSAIVSAASVYPTASLRRLGWILDRFQASVDLDQIAQRLAVEPAGRATALLDPAGPRVGVSSRRWGLVENADVEPDL
jgi:predicted transcriptional regulator of viral defense system